MDYANARQALVATVARAWYTAIEAHRLVLLAKQRVAIYNNLLNLVQVRVSAGKDTDLDLTVMKANVDSAKSELDAAEESYSQMRRSLELLLGRYPAAEIAVAKEFPDLSPLPNTGTPVEVLSRRPDLMAAEKRVLSAFRQTESARLALLPAFRLSFLGGDIADPALALLKLNPWLATGALGAYVPLYEGGALRAQIQIASSKLTNTALSVSHDGGVPSDSFSFNLAEGVSLSEATDAIRGVVDRLQIPVSVRGSFSGTANVFQNSLSSQPFLILAALITLYLVLGVLYESLLHPLTILSTLPSAGVGALLALMGFQTELSIIAMIGIILLIGIVKKNAILMIDFALTHQRKGYSSTQAIYKACQTRARPILMTTVAAMLGALPLAFANGDGEEMRRPLGIAVVGGLIMSQILTLYTTPVVFLALERLRVRFEHRGVKRIGL